MNWEFFFNALLAFGLFFVVVLTLGFYISYRRDREVSRMPKALHPTEGRYFRRYIPIGLREEYDAKKDSQSKKQEEGREKILSFRLVYAMPTLVFVLAATYFVTQHGHKFLAEVNLTEKELSELIHEQHKWQKLDAESIVNWNQVQSTMAKRPLAFISDTSTKVHKAWLAWAQDHNLDSKVCKWENWKNCAQKNSVLVISSGDWDLQQMDTMIQKGRSLMVIGPPNQLFEKNRQMFEWNKLRFHRAEAATENQLILRGDQRLTLGWEPGRSFDLNAVNNDFYLETENADAYRLMKDQEKQSWSTAWYSRVFKSDARLVWIDHFPHKTSEDSPLYAQALRFLTKTPYDSIATWPKGKAFAYSVAGDIEDQYEKVELVLDVLKKHSAPVSWYSVARMTVDNIKTTEKMAALGTINCQGDTHKVFQGQSLPQQVKRLALCKKLLKDFGLKPAQGLRPPEEKWDIITKDSATNTAYRYMFVGSLGQMAPQLFKSKLSSATMVLIPRSFTDDFQFFGYGEAGELDMKNTFSKELKEARQLGGHYSYDFHSQFMERDGHIEAIDYLLETARSMDDGVALNLEEMSDWWRVRYSLQQHNNVDEKDMQKYSPVVMRVNKKGKLTKSPYKASRKVSGF